MLTIEYKNFKTQVHIWGTKADDIAVSAHPADPTDTEPDYLSVTFKAKPDRAHEYLKLHKEHLSVFLSVEQAQKLADGLLQRLHELRELQEVEA